MTVREQLRYWGIGLFAFVLLLWLLADALLPFVLGTAIAYLADPWADWLERLGLSRILATVVITVSSVGVVVISIFLIVPMVVTQIEQAADSMPANIDQIRNLLARWLPDAQREGSQLNMALTNLRENAQTWSIGLLKGIGSFGLAIVNVITVLFVTPVVAFYLLMDWDHIIAGVDDLLPREHRDEIRKIVSELNRVIAGFVRGQLTVCLLLGAFYAVSLMIVGLNFGLLIGLFAGLISFIPFVGSVLGGLLSVGVAATQFWSEPVWILVVAVIFIIGQAVEGNFLTPKLVGDKVGLHPVWLMFALSAFGLMFGFVGLLVAVPCAAAIGVIGRYLADRYKGGGLYRGSPDWQRLEAERREQNTE